MQSKKSKVDWIKGVTDALVKLFKSKIIDFLIINVFRTVGGWQLVALKWVLKFLFNKFILPLFKTTKAAKAGVVHVKNKILEKGSKLLK